MSDILNTLNPAQREAVLATEGPVLILAGAGSGKTKALTSRVAYLITEKHVAPWNILAITFTNKAAAEMRDRVNKLVTEDAAAVWVGTFHATCVRILRRFADRVFDVHLRNTAIADNGSSGAPADAGTIDYLKVLRALKEIEYAGACGLELRNAYL